MGVITSRHGCDHIHVCLLRVGNIELAASLLMWFGGCLANDGHILYICNISARSQVMYRADENMTGDMEQQEHDR